MNKKKTFDYIAFYDLDHTILKVNSATHLVNEAKKRGIMSGKNFRLALWLSILYKLRIGDSTEIIVRMLSWLKGIREDDIDKLCKDVFSKHLVDNIRPEILETIQEHRANRGGVVLLSSASEPICRQFQVYLNMDDLICSKLESVDGILTGKTQGNLVYAREKESRLTLYCNKYGYRRAEAYYYGDSFTDEFVMNVVGFPIAVDPDKKLLRIALKNRWPIIARNRA
jgi:putative phosphoserine phosphatase/1-acylglycerol-3-phosphate O-acyltransferase